jgi:hypothetical protein
MPSTNVTVPLTPLIGMTAQLAILDRTEALTREVLRDAAGYLDLPEADENDKTR